MIARVWGTETQMWRRELERDPTERRLLEEVLKTKKGPNAPTDSGRTAHEITHLPPAPWCETCACGVVTSNHFTSDSLRWNVTNEKGPSRQELPQPGFNGVRRPQGLGSTVDRPWLDTGSTVGRQSFFQWQAVAGTRRLRSAGVAMIHFFLHESLCASTSFFSKSMHSDIIIP